MRQTPTRYSWIAGLTLSAAACGGGPETPGPAAALAYSPGADALSYQLADSATFDMQMVTVRLTSRGLVRLQSAHGPGDSVRVEAVLVDFEAVARNSMTGAQTVTEADVKGSYVLHVSPRGASRVVTEPEMTPAFRQVAGVRNLVEELFVRLPGRPVERGATWTDTIRSTADNEGLQTTSDFVVRSTWARDTIVAGTRLNVIRTRSSGTLVLSGQAQGTSITQRLRGDNTGVALWDPDRSVLIAQSVDGTVEGTLDVPAAGMSGVPIRGTVHRSSRLVEPD